LLVSKTKYFLLLDWNAQIENVVETKRCLISLCFQSCQEDVSVWCSVKVLV